MRKTIEGNSSIPLLKRSDQIAIVFIGFRASFVKAVVKRGSARNKVIIRACIKMPLDKRIQTCFKVEKINSDNETVDTASTKQKICVCVRVVDQVGVR